MLNGLEAAFFYLFAFVGVASAFMVISARNPVHSVLFLILTFFNAAGLMVLVGAEFIAMLLVSMARYFGRGAFFMSWWAMTFPADGWAGATLAYHLARPEPLTAGIAIFALTCATIIVGVVVWKTLRSIVDGTAFAED